MTSIIRVSAVVLRDSSGRVLMVRKAGTDKWMNPGGKPEPGETAAQCGARELEEELGLTLDWRLFQDLGQHRAVAANEAGFDVVADVLLWPFPVEQPVAPCAEIAALRWVTAEELTDPSLAPLFTEAIVPMIWPNN